MDLSKRISLQEGKTGKNAYFTVHFGHAELCGHKKMRGGMNRRAFYLPCKR